MSIKKYSRSHPYLAYIESRFLLTKASSTRKTYHISLHVDSAEIPFKPGDSIAIWPQNDPEEVDQILMRCNRAGGEEILDPKTNASISLRDYLLHKVNVRRVDASFVKQIFKRANVQDAFLFFPENRSRLEELLNTHSLLDFLNLYPLKDALDLTQLMPLLPRFYSIANSPLVFPNEIHLTVAYATYTSNGQVHAGVSSHFLCTLAKPHTTLLPIYIQPSHHFSLPEDPSASIILVGPGTGIAPFRAFLQHRLALQSPGRNWLFFGERNRASDFYYETFWTDLETQGRLKLDLAFSRDTPKPGYVQHKMYEQRKSLWNWLQNGAFLYVCGDAKKMAKDVDAILHRIVHEEGNCSEEDARIYIKQLRAKRHYLLDAY